MVFGVNFFKLLNFLKNDNFFLIMILGYNLFKFIIFNLNYFDIKIL